MRFHLLIKYFYLFSKLLYLNVFDSNENLIELKYINFIYINYNKNYNRYFLAERN